VAMTFKVTDAVTGLPAFIVDEFNGTQLDTTRWNIDYPSGKTESQFYAPDAFELSKGILRIQAEPRPQKGYPYSSGIITTQHTFAHNTAILKCGQDSPRAGVVARVLVVAQRPIGPGRRSIFLKFWGHNTS